jgi:hypothetical protein
MNKIILQQTQINALQNQINQLQLQIISKQSIEDIVWSKISGCYLPYSTGNGIRKNLMMLIFIII